jgi:hypothetical protein
MPLVKNAEESSQLEGKAVYSYSYERTLPSTTLTSHIWSTVANAEVKVTVPRKVTVGVKWSITIPSGRQSVTVLHTVDGIRDVLTMYKIRGIEDTDLIVSPLKEPEYTPLLHVTITALPCTLGNSIMPQLADTSSAYDMDILVWADTHPATMQEILESVGGTRHGEHASVRQ